MTAEAATRGARPEPRHVPFVAALAAVVAFLPTLWDGFVFDDGELIVDNPFVHGLSHLGRCFRTDLWDTPSRAVGDAAPHFYRPLVCAANAADWALGNGSALPFHLTNVLGHALVAAFAARALLRWIPRPGVAVAAAVLFAVHPTRSESVAWISGRTDVFSALFLLGALELVVRHGRSGAWRPLVFACVAFCAALGSKETAIAFPLFVGFEWARAARSTEPPEPARRLRRATLLFGIAAVLYVGLRAAFLPMGPPEDEPGMPLLTHAAYVLLTVGYYAARIVFPWPQTFYFRPVAFSGALPACSPLFVALGAVALGLYAAATLRAARRDSTTLGLLLLFGALLAPMSNVVPTHVPTTTADRFLYLPLLLLLGALGRAYRPSPTPSRVPALVVSALGATSLAVNFARAIDYANDAAMWYHELETNPDNPLALGKLGEAMAASGNPGEARRLLTRALSPEALRYRLLASPTHYYFGLLELAGGSLADGDAPALASLVQEIRTALSGAVPDPHRRAPGLDLPPPPADDHFRIHAENAKPHLASAGAFAASRLPGDDTVRAFVGEIPKDAPLGAAARYNLALALGRAAAYGQAREELARAAESGLPEPVRADLDATLAKVETLRRDARAVPEPRSSLARAEAFTLLGAHLRAARVLRRAVTEHPGEETLLFAYFDALVAARLDEDALAVAARLPGPPPGERLAEARRKLGARLQALPAVPASVPWAAGAPSP
ncbi:MAG TPA: hypothetical protein VHE30_10920 [Polyangiaceae bacterium]|nr:hypothetical protein [Polyangiaceae bacterium]